MRKPKTIVKKSAKAAQVSQEPVVEHSIAPSQPKELDLVAILKDEPVYVNSLGAALLGLDHGSILRELQHARQGMLRFYMSAEGGNHTPEEAIQLVDHFPEDPEKTLKFLLSQPLTAISWYGLEKLYSHDPKLTKQVWRLICEEAAHELRHGHRMAKNFEVTDWQRDPWIRAQFLAIRNGFIEEWKPKGGIELALIDMMAQTYSEYQYWVQETHRRSTTEMKDTFRSREEEERFQRANGHWIPPRVGEQAAVEHAMSMMDRYNRLFLRTLRQLRDLRRYSTPVTINNPQQVNIAADGGQQINAVKVENSG
ncbi:MAG: hypothetical protein U0Y68_24780 [Blastocatellia bacterium]